MTTNKHSPSQVGAHDAHSHKTTKNCHVLACVVSNLDWHWQPRSKVNAAGTVSLQHNPGSPMHAGDTTVL